MYRRLAVAGSKIYTTIDMKILKIAWRNIWRHPLRSTAIIVSVGFGLWAGLFIKGYMNGLVEQRLNSVITGELSHLQIHHREFREDNDQKYYIRDASGIISGIARDKRVKAVSGRLVAKGMIVSPKVTSGVQVNGIEPSSENRVSGINRKLIEGAFFPDSSRNEILIGSKLAGKLKVRLNSKVVLTLVDRNNTVTSGAFRVKGIYRTDNAPYDELNVFVKTSSLFPLTTLTDERNEIAVLLHNGDDLPAIVSDFKNSFPSLEIQDWMQLAPEMSIYVDVLDQSMVIFMGIIMLALAFAIINTMLMAVLERTSELGVLMALGMDKLLVFLMVFYETLLLVLAGLPLGALAGWLSVRYYGIRGVDLSEHKEVLASFGFSEKVYPNLNPDDFIIMLELVCLTAILSGLLPARRALKLTPSEAIRK